jgi:hypothetical protein
MCGSVAGCARDVACVAGVRDARRPPRASRLLVVAVVRGRRRTSPGYTVASLVSDDMPLPRHAFRLQWTPGPDGSRYQVRVTTEDLRELATAADLTAAELIVEPAALATLPDGATVFWQVDVLLPAGERITSPTFAVRVQ